MAYTPIPKGTDPWDEQVNNAFTDQDIRITQNAADIDAVEIVNGQQWNDITINRNNIAMLRAGGGMPADYGLQNWSYDPSQVINNVAPTSGQVVMTKMYLHAGTVTAVGCNIGAAGVGLTVNQNFMGLYDQSGNLLGTTADQSTNWLSIGYKQMALVAPATIPSAGFYYAAFLSNTATTVASLTRASNVASSTTFVNLNLSADQARYATGPTGQATLPASITMSARTPVAQTYWMTIT